MDGRRCPSEHTIKKLEEKGLKIDKDKIIKTATQTCKEYYELEHLLKYFGKSIDPKIVDQTLQMLYEQNMKDFSNFFSMLTQENRHDKELIKLFIKWIDEILESDEEWINKNEHYVKKCFNAFINASDVHAIGLQQMEEYKIRIRKIADIAFNKYEDTILATECKNSLGKKRRELAYFRWPMRGTPLKKIDFYLKGYRKYLGKKKYSLAYTSLENAERVIEMTDERDKDLRKYLKKIAKAYLEFFKHYLEDGGQARIRDLGWNDLSKKIICSLRYADTDKEEYLRETIKKLEKSNMCNKNSEILILFTETEDFKDSKRIKEMIKKTIAGTSDNSDIVRLISRAQEYLTDKETEELADLLFEKGDTYNAKEVYDEIGKQEKAAKCEQETRTKFSKANIERLKKEDIENILRGLPSDRISLLIQATEGQEREFFEFMDKLLNEEMQDKFRKSLRRQPVTISSDLKDIEKEKIKPDQEETLRIYLPQEDDFIEKKIKYKDATELQRIIFKIGSAQTSKEQKSQRIVLEYPANEILRKYLISKLPQNKWMTYNQILDLFKDTLDRQIITTKIPEENAGLGDFVDRRHNGREIEYRTTELSGKDPQKQAGTDIDNTKRLDPYRTLTAVRKLANEMGEEARTYEELYKEAGVQKTLPKRPSLRAYKEILMYLQGLDEGYFVEHWYENGKFYFTKKELIKCPYCKQKLKDCLIKPKYNGYVDITCNNCKAKFQKHVNKLIRKESIIDKIKKKIKK